MNVPAKHHFNPAFSLKPWAGGDGLVCEMRQTNGIIAPKRTHPNATGFQRNLYRTEGVSPDQEQHLEVKFMKLLDTEAARALQKIMTGDTTPWESEHRSAWTRFILSLMFRNPAVVDVIKRHIAEMWDVGVKALEENYAERRLPSDPPTFAEYFSRTHPAAPQIGASDMLAQIINNDRVGPTIFNMNWSRIDLRKSKVSLLYSDRPLDRPLGLADKRAYIALPIGPNTLFLAAHDPDLAKRLSRGNQTKIVKMINKTVVSQAREYVWGVDDSQLGFVRRHMRTAPERVIITDQQRMEAIAAAQGLMSPSTLGS